MEDSVLSESDLKNKEPVYDSDETFTYWDDDSLSHASATETESDIGDLELSSSSPVNVDHKDIAIPSPIPIKEELGVTLQCTTIVSETVHVKKEMDIISVNQEKALKRLLQVDVSNLIDDDNMKKEIKFFRELDMQTKAEQNPDIEVNKDEDSAISELRCSLCAARKRKADNFQFLLDALDNVKKLKIDCMQSMTDVQKLEDKLKLAVVPKELEDNKIIKKSVTEKAISDITQGLSTTTVTKKEEDGILHVQDTTTSRVLDCAPDLLCSRKHHEAKFICALCNKHYFDKQSFDSHLDYHTGVTHKCNLCNKPPYSNKKAYNRHMKWHADGSIYHICQECGKGFEYKYRLDSHMNTHREASLPCRKVVDYNKMFTFVNERKLHEQYGQLEQKLFQCDTCEQFYTSPPLLHVHQHKFAHSGVRYS